jgi:hypothetical protein
MSRVDQKGKLYTEWVRKAGLRVLISTVQGVVEGNVYLAPGQRVKDLLNSTAEDIVAVTEATLEWHGRTGPAQTDFITLNNGDFVWVVPFGEAEPPPGDDYQPHV